MDDTPQTGLLRRWALGPASAIVAAVIGGLFSIASAILPQYWSSEKAEAPVAPIASVPADSPSNVSKPPAQAPAAVTAKQHLTYGTWTLIESKDDAGTDWSNSVLKFTRQRETDDGLELEGFFEWRNGETLVGTEYVRGNYVEATRNLYIEGQKVEDESGELAVGSFSARLAEDNRHLLDGTWGSTAGNRAGIPGTWRARR